MEMKTIDAKQCTAIALGRLGENEYTVVRFDVSAWLEEIPGAVIGLYNQRPGDAAAYPVAGITVDGGIATWTVTSAELTQTGQGKCELVAIAGEVVAKSAIFNTIIFDALDGSGEAPEPWEEWQQQLIILKNEAEQAADRAEEAVEHYPRIVDGVWEVWDAQAGVYVSTGVQALGVDGVSPIITVAPITGGHRITITDANGTHTVDVLDGENGDAGRGIVSVQKTGTAGLVDTYTITYTDNTISTFTVTNGKDGTDGVSPTITITDITGGHRVTITDATGAHSFDVMDGEDGAGAVQDVQVNGVSVLQDGVANVPVAGSADAGVVKVSSNRGIQILTGTNAGQLATRAAASTDAKSGANSYYPIVPNIQHESTFYGLAKAAGSDEKNSTLPVGQYTDAAKSAISTMLNGPVTVSGTTPAITAIPGIQYVCGEVSTLDITLPASGCVDVVFESGSTPTVLTITPPTGQTMKWANGFNPTSLEANTTYEINIKDGLGVAASWT
jgi:hypothetical protein